MYEETIFRNAIKTVIIACIMYSDVVECLDAGLTFP